MTESDNRLLRIEAKLDDIYKLLSQDRVALAEYKGRTDSQVDKVKNDVAWMRGSVKIMLFSIVPIILTIVSIVVRFFKHV